MDQSAVRSAALRYGVVAGPLTVGLLTAVAVGVDFPLKLLGMLALGVPLFVVPGVLGITDTGIETASSNAFVGADVGDPSDYQADHSVPIPNVLEVICWLSGVGVAGGVLLAVVA